MSDYILLQQELSLYSGKARSYLRYKNIPFVQQFASLNAYRKTILPKTGVAMIPVVVTPEGEALQDTTVIIDWFEARFPDRPVYPETPLQKIAAMLLELYGDEWLLLPAMHYRWNFPKDNDDFIYSEFGRVVWQNGPKFFRRAVGKKLGNQFRGFVEPLGISAATIPAIEQWWQETLDVLSAHFDRYPYLLGHRASVGDFGFMGPLYAHLSRDPYPGKLMRERAPQVQAWVERMNQTHPQIGDWIDGDDVPQTLDSIFKRQFAEQFPVLKDTAEHLPEWVAQNPGKILPRSIGKHDFTIGEAKGQRRRLTYSLWMWQRVLDAYASLGEPDKQSVDAWLARLGHAGVLEYRMPLRIGRKNNRCVIED